MLVSILIPCYNAERWIAQCIQSALDQTWPEKEVIVVDDGSTDGSLKIIQSFGDRIRWETGPNRGGNVTRNRLLELSRGEWLQYLDADDYLLPDKIGKQMQFMERHSDADVVFSRYIQETHQKDGVHQATGLMPPPLDTWCLLVRWDLPQTGALLWRREAILSVGAWKVDQPCCQEHELYLRMLQAGRHFYYCEEVGAVYRQWAGGSVCTRNPAEVHRRRIEIINQAEQFLRKHQYLTSERLWAINHARLEVARRVWQYNQSFARDIDRTIRQSLPEFVPDGPGGRITYGLAYRMGYNYLGFQMAEWLACALRLLMPSRSQRPDPGGLNWPEGTNSAYP